MVEEGEQIVGGVVALRMGAEWCCSGDRWLFESHVGVEVNPDDGRTFMAQPEGDDSDVDPSEQ